jgi:hypothetical protein
MKPFSCDEHHTRDYGLPMGQAETTMFERPFATGRLIENIRNEQEM